ncbi:carotenoid biosynthesis protein [Bacillus timonensis]|nr:carotenoid biosynthesis protein [Bacillus timonensis]
MKQFEKVIYYLFLVWYTIGIILLSFNLLPPSLEWANFVYFVIIGLLTVIYFTHLFSILKGIAISLVIFFFSISVELIGVKTGLLFGNYYYTDQFGPLVFGVPVAIGLAWLMVIGSSYAVTYTILGTKKTVFSIIVASLLAVLMDAIIDPVAFVIKQYWIWEATSFYYNIPMKNFLTWFVVATLLHLFISTMSHSNQSRKREWNHKMSSVYFLNILMFVMIAVVHELWLAIAITSTFTILVFYYYMKQKRSELTR